MGLIDFVKDAGRKVGMFGGREAAEAEAAKQAANDAAKKAGAAADEAAKRDAVAADVKAAILSYVAVEDLAVRFDGFTVALTGSAASQADREKAVLVAGNTEGVSRVDDQLAVATPEAASELHRVVSGDTLSAIAARYYGVMRLYDAILDANRPMLESADRIYPGQVLRIPPVAAPEHVVRPGETLGAVARFWYGDVARSAELAAANGIVDPDRLQVGQKLTIPLRRPARAVA